MAAWSSAQKYILLRTTRVDQSVCTHSSALDVAPAGSHSSPWHRGCRSACVRIRPSGRCPEPQAVQQHVGFARAAVFGGVCGFGRDQVCGVRAAVVPGSPSERVTSSPFLGQSRAEPAPAPNRRFRSSYPQPVTDRKGAACDECDGLRSGLQRPICLDQPDNHGPRLPRKQAGEIDVSLSEAGIRLRRKLWFTQHNN